MPSAFGEASTVVGDSFKPRDDSPFPVKEKSGRATTSNLLDSAATSKSKEKADDFVATMDYTLEERPFFVRIGKDGVIAALERLDRQLVDVSSQLCCYVGMPGCLFATTQAGRNKVLSTKSPTDWTGKEVIPGRMGLINHGYVPYSHICSKIESLMVLL